MPPLSRIDLENSLNGLAREAQDVGGWNRTTWNHRVKEELIRLGLDEGCKTCASGVSKASANTWPEWLYDVVWLRVSDGFAVNDVCLVAEIEWGADWEVWEDFQKLLVARANTRVMIFDEKPGLLDSFFAQIKNFRLTQQGDQYLLASYSMKTRRFSVHEFTSG